MELEFLVTGASTITKLLRLSNFDVAYNSYPCSMSSSDLLNYALTVLVGFIILFGLVGTALLVKLLKVATQLAKEASVMLVALKTIKSGLSYTAFDFLSKGLNMFSTKRR